MASSWPNFWANPVTFTLYAAGPWLDLGRLPAHGRAHLAEPIFAEGAGLRLVGLAEEVQRGEDLAAGRPLRPRLSPGTLRLARSLHR